MNTECRIIVMRPDDGEADGSRDIKSSFVEGKEAGVCLRRRGGEGLEGLELESSGVIRSD